METITKFQENFSILHNPTIRRIALSLGLVFGITNFSYSQKSLNSGISQQFEQNIDTSNEILVAYNSELQTRNYRIGRTSETLEQYANRIGNQFSNDLKDGNSELPIKLRILEKFLGDNYNIPVYVNDPIKTIESILRILANNEKYKGLSTYTDNFSGSYDINLVNAIGFTQFVNSLPFSGCLLSTNTIIFDKWLADLHAIKNNGNIVQAPANNNGGSTVNNGGSTVNNGGSSVNNGGSSVNNGGSSVNNGGSTVNNGGSSVNNGGSSVNNGGSSVNNGGSSVNNNPNQISPDGNNNPNGNMYADHMIKLDVLSSTLSPNNLDGVDYEDVLDMVESIINKGLRDEVFSRLLQNDVIGAQKLFGMELNCSKTRYPKYVAGKKLGQRELDLMREHGQVRSYLGYNSVISYFEDIENSYRQQGFDIENYEAKLVYMKYFSGELSNGGLPYCIVSKYDCMAYFFTADHKLVESQPVLLGSDVGDAPNDPRHGSQTTPGGRYKIIGEYDKGELGNSFRPLYGSTYLAIRPLENQYNYKVEHDAYGNPTTPYTMGLHGFLNGRESKFYSGAIQDSRCTNGCFNFLRKTFGSVRNHLKKNSIVHVTHDDE